MDQAKRFLRWSSLPGVLIGVLVTLNFQPPLIGIALGAIMATIFLGKNPWREYTFHGLLVGAVIGVVAALIQMPGELASSGKSGFQFYDSLLLYLIFGLVGGGIVGYFSGAISKSIMNLRN